MLRKAFAGCALLFLRWALQQKEMCFGVIHGLGNDDDDDLLFMFCPYYRIGFLWKSPWCPVGLWTFGFLDSQSHDPVLFNSEDVQNIMAYLRPRPFGWSVINKVLLHSDFLVKHGNLRLLLEALKLLDSFIGALNRSSYSSNQMM